ncbi:MAG: AAA family ATPase, partial [Clostridia bacterium]|nr:AAA family ATPase [Clostridia bacterium]
MGKVISVINMKGGVGKTTLCIGVADFLSEIGKRILLIDADPQFNATQAMLSYYKKDDPEDEENYYTREVLSNQKTIYRLFIRPLDMSSTYNTPEASDVIVNLKDNLDILCGDLNLVLVNQSNDSRFAKRIRNFIDDNNLRQSYDYILIDCPPT